MSTQQPSFNFTDRHSVGVMSNDPSRNRSRGSQESADAHEKVMYSKTEMYERILKLARARGSYGITVKEVAASFGKTPNEVSGRLSELRIHFKKLRKTGERRYGAAVLEIV
jgi:hypothetical protein